MQGISTLTQKGQVVIPHSIRKKLGLRKSTKLYFEIEGDKIVASPILSIDEAFGMIPAKKPLSKAEMKRVIREAVVKKFQKRQ